MIYEPAENKSIPAAIGRVVDQFDNHRDGASWPSALAANVRAGAAGNVQTAGIETCGTTCATNETAGVDVGYGKAAWYR